MRFRFNDAKTAQAAAEFLRLSGGTLPYMVLIKLLYMADRQMILDHGQPITGDRLVSMDHGPVLSGVLDLITHGPKRNTKSSWFKLIDAPSGYDISLKDPAAPTDELSRYELRLLADVHEKFGAIDRWDLVKMLHTILPEWTDPDGSAIRIDPADILRAESRSEDEIERVRQDAQDLYFMASMA